MRPEGGATLRELAQAESSRELLPAIDAVLAAAGLTVSELGGLVAAAGPGSFTGLRVGLACGLGLAQALDLPAATVPTLQALALAAGEAETSRPVLAVVDALRGEFFAQAFAPGPVPVALGEPVRLPAAELPAFCPDAGVVVGFGAAALVTAVPWPTGTLAHEPGPLAPLLGKIALAGGVAWDLAALTRPLYLRPPALSLPR